MPPYRDEPPPAPRDPREEAAVAELVARTRAVRGAVIVLHVLVGITAGSILYAMLRDLQLAHRGAHSPYVTAMIAMLPTFGAMLRLAPWTARVALKALLPRWRTSLAAKYALDVVAFEELTTLLER